MCVCVICAMCVCVCVCHKPIYLFIFISAYMSISHRRGKRCDQMFTSVQRFQTSWHYYQGTALFTRRQFKIANCKCLLQYSSRVSVWYSRKQGKILTDKLQQTICKLWWVSLLPIFDAESRRTLQYRNFSAIEWQKR